MRNLSIVNKRHQGGLLMLPSRLLGLRRWLVLGLAVMAWASVAISGYPQTPTTTALVSSLNPSSEGDSVIFTATVTITASGSPVPGGTVTFKDGGTPISGTIPVNTTTGEASFSTDSLTIRTHPITAHYSGCTYELETYASSVSNVVDQEVKRATKTTVFCADTPLIVNNTATGTVTVTDISTGAPSTPTGTVTLSVSPLGEGTLSLGTYSPGAVGQCTFTYTYTPSSGATTLHTISADYNGSTIHGSSSGTFDQAIVKRAADIQIEATPTDAHVLQPVALTIHVQDDTTEGAPGDLGDETITLSTDSTSGWFESEDPGTDYDATLDASGNATVTYTPGYGEIGTTTITASFEGSDVYSASEGSRQITVSLRPTQTTVTNVSNLDVLVNEQTTITVTVTDLAGTGSAPLGTIAWDTTLPSAGTDVEINQTSYTPNDGTGETVWTFTYKRKRLDAEGVDFDELTFTYQPYESPGLGKSHLGSEGRCGVSVSRRPTQITLGTCSTATKAAQGFDGFQITASVAEHPDNSGHGAAVAIGGDLYRVGEDGSDVHVTAVPPTSTTVDIETTLPIATPIIKYVPDDDVHAPIIASPDEPCKRNITPPSGDGSTGANCDDGCGTGGTNIDQMIFDMNASAVALHATQMGLSAASIVASLIPNPVWAAGIVFSSGTEIPLKDIVQAALNGTSLLIEVAIVALQTDLDGDGLYDVIENTVTNTDYNVYDSDGDGLGDGYEVTVAGGFYGGSRRPSPNDWDSDGDGLSDGEEGPLNTSYCVADTDCDTLTDKQEVDTWGEGDLRLHLDPLLQDTDSDGISDYIEFYVTHSPCPFGNEPDSDGDGLIDGYEDKNLDGCWGDHDPGVMPGDPGYCTGGITVGDSTNQASRTITWWETNLCDPDTDDDGLSDGEEEGLFAAGEVTPKDVSTTVGVEGGNLGVTVPALDSDMDNDGLTDYEEVNTYQTDPMDADTDDDTVSDGIEVATWDSAIATRLGKTASSDSRNHANPREADTDGDGLTDNFEIAYGCNCGTGTDGYVNDDDSDDDGLQDGREFELFGTGADLETAGTGATAANDGELGTDTVCCLCDPDSDDDGLSDGEEIHIGTDPRDWDSDNDGLSDREELQIYFTDPNNADTDGDNASGILPKRPKTLELPSPGYNGSTSTETYDGITFDVYDILLGSDGEEALSRTGVDPFGALGDQSDPLSKDTDGDGIGDEIEFKPGCNCGAGGGASQDGYVNDADSDDDGLQDGPDSQLHLASWDAADYGKDVDAAFGNDGELNDDDICAICDYDCDGDGLSDGEEVYTGTDPLDWDSDDDGLSDLEELQIYFTDPNVADTDGDQADGNIAARDPTISPTIPGHSDVGTIYALSDCEEALSGTSYPPFGNPQDETDPLQVDTDGDGLPDAIEFRVGCSCEHTPGSDCSPYDPIVTYDPTKDGYANSFDSDGDGLRDDLDIAADVAASDGNNGELYDDETHSICDPDSDGDGLLDGEEHQTDTDPLDWDSDDDGLSDREELQTYFTDPNLHDTDGDGADGNIEARVHTIEPTLLGHSGNGTIDARSDCEEAFSGTSYPPFGNPFDETDPLQLDTDGDGLGDEIEFKVGCSCATTDWSACPLVPVGWEYPDTNSYGVTYDPIKDGYANNYDSDDDGLRDGKDVHEDLVEADVSFPGKVFTILGEHCVDLTLREQRNDSIHSICDPDSDGDGLLDGEEFAIGTDWLDWDTDDDGRNDWHEHTGGEQVTKTDPIPTDPFDPDTDDDGLLDSAEVFGLNNTNPVNADTDGDGLCDGGTGTPYMTSGDPTVNVNPICKSCAQPGLASCGAAGVRTGSADGIGDHPNPHGYGEDKDGDGQWDGSIGDEWQSGEEGTPETDPNQYDTDGDAEGDGIEVLGFSTSRQSWIPTTDLFGRTINVTYPACGCLEPLIADTDGDGLSDGYEDNNHDGNFDFLPSDFDYAPDPLPGPPQPNPNETNPCDPDTDDDDLTDYEERYQSQVFVHYDDLTRPFNPTNPLDHDTDNDWLLDGFEVKYVCVAVTYSQLDNDGDALIDEDPIDGLDNDGDGLIDEDPVDFFVRFVPMLDPTNRDSDSDGFIDGLDDDPCNSECIPVVLPPTIVPVDTDGDGFSDDSELAAGTHPNDPEDHPIPFCLDLDFDQWMDDRIWLEPSICCGIANSAVIDIDSNVLIDFRLQIVQPRDVQTGDFDGDGAEDDMRYIVEYAFADYRVLQPRIVATIDDYDADLVIDWVVVERK